MTFSLNDSALFAGLDQLLGLIPDGAEDGLQDGARLWQAEMQASPAHGDQSGATHASYRAFVIGGTHTGDAEASDGYAAAASRLSNFTGHQGIPLRQESGVRLGPDERGILGTAFTDYQDTLETVHAGEKAVIGPTLQANAEQFTRLAADGIRRNLD